MSSLGKLQLGALQEWQALRHAGIWHLWRRYFQMQFVTPPLPFLQPNKPFLIVQVPHGVYPFAGLLALSQCGLQGSGQWLFLFLSLDCLSMPDISPNMMALTPVILPVESLDLRN